MGIHEDMRDEIAKVAYNLWEKSGRIQGREVENWVEAERIVMVRFRELNKPKEESKKTAPYEKMPVELKKASTKEMKKEVTEKKVVAKKTATKAKSTKETRKTK